MQKLLIMYRMHIVFAILCTFCGGCVASSSESVPTRMTEKKLQALVGPLVAWDQVRPSGLSSMEWSNFVAVAKVIQASEPKSVERALHLYQLGGEGESNFYNFVGPDDSKLFLLMRVVFVLPESVPQQEYHFFAGWTPSPGLYNADGSMNQSWPIKWNNGHPKLTGAFQGNQGINARYDASAEYAFFRARYHIRDLSGFGKK